MRLVNLRSVTCYTDQNFKENAHFGALNLFTSEKRLKLSYKTSINLEDLDSDFVLQQEKMSNSSTNMITNMPAPNHLDELLCHLQCFSKDQRKKDRSDFELGTMSSFQKTPASHWRVNTYSTLRFKRIYLKVCL